MHQLQVLLVVLRSMFRSFHEQLGMTRRSRGPYPSPFLRDLNAPSTFFSSLGMVPDLEVQILMSVMVPYLEVEILTNIMRAQIFGNKTGLGGGLLPATGLASVASAGLASAF